MLDFLKPKDAPAATPDEHATSLGTGAADNSTAGAGGVAAAAIEAARETARGELDLSPRARKPGRPRKGTGAGGADHQELQDRIAAEVRSQLEALHSPESWGALLGAPSDMAVALTGKAYWEISATERKTLGMTGAAAARTFLITNPRALALAMVSGALVSVYLPRFIKQMEDIRKARKEAEKKP